MGEYGSSVPFVACQGGRLHDFLEGEPMVYRRRSGPDATSNDDFVRIENGFQRNPRKPLKVAST